MASTLFPTGFRFHPTDVELIMYYLKFKVMGKRFPFEAISEINIYKYSPSDLPDKSILKSKDREWFFFCPRENKYNSGGRIKRATENGFWKATGKDRFVNYRGRVVGMIKTLVFYQGSPPGGERTDWVMHEYRLEDQKLVDVGVAQDAFVVCKVFHKNGPGPRVGAQHGAHIDEEEWDNESPVCTCFLTGDPSVPCAVTHPLPTSGPEVSSLEALCSVPSVAEGSTSIAFDDTLHSLSSFTGYDSVTVQDDNIHEKLDQENNMVPVGGLEGNDIFNSLPDLPSWQAMFNQASCSFSGADSYIEEDDFDICLDSINNLDQQMPSQNYDSCVNRQFYNRGGSFGSAEIQPLGDSYLELADFDIPLNPINNLYSGIGSFSSTQHSPNSDYSLDVADLDIPPSPIHNLVQVPGTNYNSLIEPRYYYEGGSSSMQCTVNSSQVPSLAAGSDGVGDVSNILQVNFDASDANFSFWQPSDPVEINRFNNRG